MANITPSQRLAALHSAKSLLAGEQGSTILGKNNVAGPKALPMIRLAEYILSGNDYRDVHEVKPATHLTPADDDPAMNCDEDSPAGPPLVREEGSDAWTSADRDGAL